MTDLYSYPKSWGHKSSIRTLEISIRNSYFKKGVLLLLLLPIDILINFLISAYCRNNNSKIILLTEKWSNLGEAFAASSSMSIIGLPKNIIFCLRNRCCYFLINPIYIILAFGFLLPSRQRVIISNLALLIAKYQLKRYSDGKSKLIVHSDALPFARAYTTAANELGMHTICIQHGSFYKSHLVGERDGFLCQTNIVRSVIDGEIIKDANKFTNIYVADEFFRINISVLKKSINDKVTIMLLGEGFHVMDKKFSSSYMSALKKLNMYYANLNIDVVFRPHPSEFWFNYLGDFKRIDKLQLNKSLAMVDAVIGFSSSLLLEAAQIGIPSFHIEIDGFRRDGLNRDCLRVHFLNSPDDAIKAAQDYCEFKNASLPKSLNANSNANLVKYILSINS
jgi:hypothetical protein